MVEVCRLAVLVVPLLLVDNDDGNGNQSGIVKLYHFTNGSWGQVGSNIHGETNDELYECVINDTGDIVAIGAPFADRNNLQNNGYVAVYQLVNNAWSLMGSLLYGEQYQGLVVA